MASQESSVTIEAKCQHLSETNKNLTSPTFYRVGGQLELYMQFCKSGAAVAW